MTEITTTGEPLPEPAWNLLFSDPREVEAAANFWRIVVIEMRDRDLLAEANAHSVQRLVLAWLLYDRAARAVAEHGAVIPPAGSNPNAIARLSPTWTTMRDASAEASSLEAELGLSPRRRRDATKAERRSRAARAADSYLRPLDGGKGRPG